MDGEEEIINVECHLWNCFSYFYWEVVSSFFKEIVVFRECVLKNFGQQKMKIKKHSRRSTK